MLLIAVNTILKTTSIVAALLTCVAIAQTSSAANATVIVGPSNEGIVQDIFSPSTVSISVNDSVIWNWQSTFHSTTSGTNGTAGDDNGTPSGLWDSGLIFSTPHFFTNTFTAPGTYSYYCQYHYFEGMTGEVVVAGSTLPVPPTIGITSPTNGSVFAAPANVSIQAGVTKGSGTVTNVQFLLDNAVFANQSSAPFSATANNLAAGPHTLSVVAQDDAGLSATKSVTISVVTPTSVSLTNGSRLSGNDFQFSYSADVGLSYVVQRSSDLTNWIPVGTNTASSNPAFFDDPNATNDLDFYRVGRLPNP